MVCEENKRVPLLEQVLYCHVKLGMLLYGDGKPDFTDFDHANAIGYPYEG